MRPIRRITIIVLLAIFLLPGLLQARAPIGFWERAGVGGSGSLLDTVWNLLAFFWPNSGSGSLTKTGVGLDPAGSSTPGDTTGSGEPSGTTSDGGDGDTGVGLDPSGEP